MLLGRNDFFTYYVGGLFGTVFWGSIGSIEPAEQKKWKEHEGEVGCFI